MTVAISNLPSGQAIKWADDGSADIGDSAGHRPNKIYAANWIVGSRVYPGGSACAFLFGASASNITLYNNGATGFGLLQFGGESPSFPALKRNSTGIDFRLADDTAYTSLTASNATLAAGTIATSQPVTITQTFNAGAVDFTAFKINTTNTSSNSVTWIDIQASSVSKLTVAPSGSNVFFNSSGAILIGANGAPGIGITNTQATLAASAVLGFSADGNTAASPDTILTRATAASLQHGAADADTNAAIVAQTTRSQGLAAGGTSDQAGKDWTFIASPGKGTGAGGKFLFQAAKAGSTGTTVNTANTVFTLDSVNSYGLFPAGTNLAAPLKFTSGTNLTTAAAGAVEFDGTCFYTTAAASSRQICDAEQYVTVQGSAVALSNSSTGVQNIFAAANDVLTLAATTTYFFEAYFSFGVSGGTTHTTAIGFPASSAYTAIHYWSELWSITSGTISTTAPSVLDVAASTATVLNATSTATTTIIRIKGIIRTNGATTCTPQVTFSAGPGGTCQTNIDSFFRIWPVGSNTVAAVGNWA